MFATVNQSLTRTVVGALGTVFCAGLCLVGVTAPAQAADFAAAPRTATVVYADLNLANPAGRAQLDRRIKAAARSVCAQGSVEPAIRAAEVRCVRAAVRSAQPRTIAATDAAVVG